MNQSNFELPVKQVIEISRCDRWQACQRLEELGIACHCREDGRLYAELNSPTTALQVRSVVWQLTAPRQKLIQWLEQCWRVDS